MIIAVIPARGGSKRIPRKNIKDFCGRPMIAWSIEAAKASGLFDHIIVSTDDAEIAKIARTWGAEVPFIRPAELADDYVGTGAVVKHTAEWFAEHIGMPGFVCTIYATAPFIRSSDIRKGLDMLLSSNSEQAFTITTFPSPIQRALRITSSGRVTMFHPENYQVRSQDLEPAYHDAGQFYWARSASILNSPSVFPENAIPIILPRYRVQDIDTPEDWQRAELIFKALQLSEGEKYEGNNNR